VEGFGFRIWCVGCRRHLWAAATPIGAEVVFQEAGGEGHKNEATHDEVGGETIEAVHGGYQHRDRACIYLRVGSWRLWIGVWGLGVGNEHRVWGAGCRM
jgi:hypothetical protein